MSAFYYEGSRASGALFVRADVTYLRQDFSEVQSVENAKIFDRTKEPGICPLWRPGSV